MASSEETPFERTFSSVCDGLEDTLEALKFNRYEIDVSEEIRVRAARSVQRMIEIG